MAKFSAIFRRSSTGTIALLCAALFGPIASGAIGDLPIESFEYRGNGAARTHWAATRTEGGSIIASGSGLVALRGGKWEQLTTEGNFEWQSLLADTDGRVWAGAANEIGVFEPDLAGVLRYRSLTSLLPENAREIGDVWNIHFADSEAVYVGKGWVVRTDGRSAESSFIPVNRRLCSWIDAGRVYIGDDDGKVYGLGVEGLLLVPKPMLGSDSYVAWAEHFEDDNWVAITEEGLVSKSAAGPDVFEPVNKIVRRTGFVAARRIEDGRLAIATYFGGLFLVDTHTGEFDHVALQEGLSSASVVGLVHSGDGWLWVATTRGLDRVATSGSVSRIRNGAGVDGVVLRDVERVADSAIVSTDSGRFEIQTKGSEREINKLDHRWFLSQARLGDELIGGTMGGLYSIANGKRRRVIAEAEDVVAVVVPSSSDDLVIYATDSALRAARKRGEEFEVVASEPVAGQAASMVEGPDGDLWLTAGSVVSRFSLAATGDRFVRRSLHEIRRNDGPSGQKARVFSIGDSIYVLRDGVLFGIDSPSGEFRPVPDLRDVVFADMASDSAHGAWALARPARSAAESPRLVRLGVVDGRLTAATIEAPGVLSMGVLRNIHVAELATGGIEVWIGATDGILRIDPSRLAQAPPPPALTVQLARATTGIATDVPKSVAAFPHARSSFNFRWSAADKVPGDLIVETRIAGAEENWTPAGDRAEREFTGLGDGSYVFEVRAIDALGRPGPVASRALTILPPWYRTPSAVSAFFAVALAFGWIGWQLRVRVARQRAVELEGLVESRTRELARVNAEMTRFIARMNHEIRNPLNGLLGAVGVLEQFAHSGREGRMMQILRACADHLGAVVEDVLDFSNIEGGRIVVQDRAFSVAEMVEAAPRMMLAEADRTGTEVVTTISPDVPSLIVADPDRIRQILVNFLGNALKYAPGEPVHIDVSTSTVEEAPWLRFAVRDHGPGISEGDKQHLFKMFERGRSQAKRKVRGMGIGLATCRLLARRMGGEVGVISGLGEGSEFFLRLPLKVEVEAGVAPAPVAGPQTDLHKLACLLVEDQEFNRVILKDMLTRVGCTVDEAADAETALNLAAMNRYDVVFTDLELPDAAPGEILKMLKDQQSAATAPVPALVVTTAYATENVRQTCLGAGAVAFLAKPLSQSKLLAVLREIDSARQPAASVEAPVCEPDRERAAGMIFHLASIRGCDVRGVAAEIAGDIEEEVRRMRASVEAANPREVRQQAHRLLSLAAMAEAPELAAAAAAIQGDARGGHMPAASRFDALAAAVASARGKLAAITAADAPAGARSRARGRSEPTASSHSD